MERTKRILGHLAGSSPSSSHPQQKDQTFENVSGGRIRTFGDRGLLSNATSGGNPSPFLSGGFAPVRRELEGQECLCVFGRLPADMDGMYCKNGPNAFFDPPADAPYHWFDGDGMVHGVDIRNGHATYTNRYVSSRRLQQDKTRGYSVYNMGALNAGDLSATLDDRVMDPTTGRLYGRMNTNVSPRISLITG